MDNQNALKKKKTRNWVVGLIVVLIAVFVLLQFSSARAGYAPAEVAGKVVSMNVAETVNASGSLQAQPFASLAWSTDGVVEDVYVKAGDQVKAGDVLMKLNVNSVSSSILSAQANLAIAQKDLEDLLITSDADSAQAAIDLKDAKEAYDQAASYLKYLQTSQRVHQTQTKIFIEETFGRWKYRYKTKYFVGPASQDLLTDAENDAALKKGQLEDAQRTYDRLKGGANVQDVTAAQAKIDAAQATLDSMSIIAPFDGEVLYVESQPGDVVNTKSIALNMANLDHPYIEAQISESEIANVKVGDPVVATLDAAPTIDLKGKVAAIDALGEVNSGSVQYTVRIDIDKASKDVSLPLGSTANATIQVEPAKTSLTVPITAIQNDEKGEYVLVVQSDGSTRRVDVVGGAIVGDRVVVTGDLTEGDSLTTSQNNNVVPRGPFRRRN